MIFFAFKGIAMNMRKAIERVLCGVVLLALTCAASRAQNITEYTASGGFGIVAGPDGALWITNNSTVNAKISKMTTSGLVTEYALSNPVSQPTLIARGPDGALWFAEAGAGANRIGRITTSGAISEYSIPSGNSPYAITAGPDGALWFTASGSRIGRIATNGAINEFTVPTTTTLTSITTGPDGALWFTEGTGNKIGRITTTGTINEYPIPTMNAGPQTIVSGPDGALWFTELTANKIGRITTAGVVTEHTVPTPNPAGGPWGIVAGPDGALWFTENFGPALVAGAKIGRVTTAGVFTEYIIPTPSSPYHITVGPDGALWFAQSNKIGRVQLPQSRAGVISHIAAGAGWSTIITLVNTSASTVPVTVAFMSGDGTSLVLPYTLTQQGAVQTGSAGSLNAMVNPNATVLISVGEQLSSTVVGWADVTSTGQVNGYAIFRQTPRTGPASEGTVPLQTQSTTAITLPYDNTANFVMGVALANLAPAVESVTATIWDELGNQIGTQAIAIAANGHTSFVLPNQLPVTAGRRGMIRFQASPSGGLAGIGLRFSPINTFTSVPAMLQ